MTHTVFETKRLLVRRATVAGAGMYVAAGLEGKRRVGNRRGPPQRASRRASWRARGGSIAFAAVVGLATVAIVALGKSPINDVVGDSYLPTMHRTGGL